MSSNEKGVLNILSNILLYKNMNNNLDKNQEEMNDEKYKLACRKDTQMVKRIFLNKRSILIFIILVIALFVVNNYKQKTVDEVVNSNVIEDQTAVIENVDNYEKPEIEETEKKDIFFDVFGDHQIKFGEDSFKFENFSTTRENAFTAMYSDALDASVTQEISITQYGEEISVEALLDEYILENTKGAYGARSINVDREDDAYFVSISDVYDYDNSFADLSLTKIFAKEGNTYLINYEKRVRGNALQTAYNWTNGDYWKYEDNFKEIDLSYPEFVYKESLDISSNLSKANRYKDVKWETKTIKENNAYANIDLEFPEFTGGVVAEGLNQVVKDIVLGTLAEDRKAVEEWKKDEENTYTDSEGDAIFGCHGDEDYFYSCSVNLFSSFKVGTIIKDIISIEITLTDYTGGGNGNHSYVKTVIYDLKNNKQLFIDNLFCGDNYLDNIKNIMKANLAVRPVFDFIDYTEDSELLSNLENISFNDIGIKLIFDPYIYTCGADGIYEMFIPYSLIKDNNCFNGNSKDILIRRELLGLDVPARLSDSCGFMSKDCDGFRFFEGKMNDVDYDNLDREESSMSINFEDYVIGNILESSKETEILVTSYNWQWASSGQGLYVIKIDGNNLKLISRIDTGKLGAEEIKIKDNKIYFTSKELGNNTESKQSCYFRNNVLEESSLICD